MCIIHSLNREAIIVLTASALRDGIYPVINAVESLCSGLNLSSTWTKIKKKIFGEDKLPAVSPAITPLRWGDCLSV